MLLSVHQAHLAIELLIELLFLFQKPAGSQTLS
jgi:hypothetical protein